jgi:signal transduction histidine kinase
MKIIREMPELWNGSVNMQAFKKFFSAPSYPDEETTRRAGLLSFILNLHIIVALSTTFVLIAFLRTTPIYPLAAFISSLVGFGLRALMWCGRMRLASILFLGMALLLMPTIAWFSKSSVATASVTAFQIMTVVMAGLLLGGLGAGVFVLLTVVINGTLIYAELHGVYVPDPVRDLVSSWFMQMITFSAITGMLYLTNRLIRESFMRAHRENEERRAAEQHVLQLNLELEQRVLERTTELEAKNKELETFSYSVSHDLRAPLRTISSFARIVKDDFSGSMDPMGRGFLDKIIASGIKMNQLIDDLLDFSRINRKQLDKQEVDLHTLVQSVIESLTPETANRQIEWIVTELPIAQVDPILFPQVYANLIGNAVKYTRKRELVRIEVGSFSQNGETIYFVRDNGAGFDMRYADRLFGVFQRLHRDDEFEGTGIGLATVQRIIHGHGGRIWAEAEVNKGATFYFTLS